jgi:hypothetical protein
MDPDPDHFVRATGRITRWMVLLGGTATLAGLALHGWQWAGGFLLGAGAAWFNFRWLKQLVDALDGGSAASRPRKRFALALGLRYVLLGVAAYAILLCSPLSLRAALVGLFVPVAAVILEMLFELLYARA